MALPRGHDDRGRAELDLDAVVAPFRDLDPGLCLAIEGADGTPIASTSLARPAGDVVTREIPAGALVGGRIRVWGAASGGGLPRRPWPNPSRPRSQRRP